MKVTSLKYTISHLTINGKPVYAPTIWQECDDDITRGSHMQWFSEMYMVNDAIIKNIRFHVEFYNDENLYNAKLEYNDAITQTEKEYFDLILRDVRP